MKKEYCMPTTVVVWCGSEVNILATSSEPEITENIGAKENKIEFEWEGVESVSPWEEEKEED